MRKRRDVPLISIGMPVFNGAKFMRESIESILAQDFEDFELIISDNGSTDETPDIASELARTDDRIKYSRLKANIGAAKNYNRVFNQSTGTFFKWSPHDDLISPHFLRRCLEGFDACDPSTIIVYSQSKFIDGSGCLISYPLRLHEMQSNSRFAARRTFRVLRAIGLVTSILGLMRKEAIRKTRLIDSFPISDFAFLFEVAMLGKIARIDDVLLFRRIHSEMSRQANMKKEDVMKWFDPNSKNIWLSERHNLYLECVRSAARLEDVSLFDRLTCAGSVLARLVVIDPRIAIGRWRREFFPRSA